MANRRSVLIGLGGLVAGGGAILSTGAFDTVEAQRTVSVETAGDADALLALTAADQDGDGDTSDNPYVSTTEDGQITINLDDNDQDVANASGLNQNAITTFNELVQITNNGTQDVGTLEFEIDADSDNNDGVLRIVHDGSPVEDDGSTAGVYTTGNVLDSDLTVGGSETFGLEVNLLDDNNPSQLNEGANFTLTITAEAVTSQTGSS